jgi:hypothetical protein
VHVKRMNKFLDQKVFEVVKEDYSAGYALGAGKQDHSISITVEDNGKSQLIDNLCNVKPYSIVTVIIYSHIC